MAKNKTIEPNGQIILKHHEWESASGHVEGEHRIDLSVSDIDKSELILIDNFTERKFYPGNVNEKRATKHKISIDSLIQLVKDHGEIARDT